MTTVRSGRLGSARSPATCGVSADSAKASVRLPLLARDDGVVLEPVDQLVQLLDDYVESPIAGEWESFVIGDRREAAYLDAREPGALAEESERVRMDRTDVCEVAVEVDR